MYSHFFGARGMKNYPLFFLLLSEKKSVFTKGVSSISDALCKIKRRKYLSAFFEREKFFFLFAKQNARLVLVRSCACVNYYKGYVCVILRYFFFFSKFSHSRSKKKGAQKARQTKREKRVFWNNITAQKKNTRFFVPFVAVARTPKKENRECVSPDQNNNTSARRWLVQFKRLEGERERERGRTHPAIPGKF